MLPRSRPRTPLFTNPYRREPLPELLQALLSALGVAAEVSAAVFADADALDGPPLQAMGTM